MDYGANRQLWATGIKVAREVIKGEEGSPDVTRVTRPFQIGANRLLTNENPDGRFGAIAESNLQGYLDAVKQDVELLASITQTPAHYLLGTVANLSADALKAAEAGLVSKVQAACPPPGRGLGGGRQAGPPAHRQARRGRRGR